MRLDSAAGMGAAGPIWNGIREMGEAAAGSGRDCLPSAYRSGISGKWIAFYGTISGDTLR